MSIIIKKLKSTVGIVKTTKDLIYKQQVVNSHNILNSYEKLVEQNKQLPSFVKYGNNKLFLTNEKSDISKMSTLFKLHSNLTEKAYKTNKEAANVKNIATSEIFNSLWIEGVRSSKKKIKQFLKKENTNVTDAIHKYSRNYNEALNFVFNTDNINEQNLYALYIILSKDIDLGDEQLDSYPYRLSDVEIGSLDNLGIDPHQIKQSMDSIFNLIKKEKEEGTDKYIVVINSILIHYLFELIHPYYDMNGRMGRLLTIWYANTNKLGIYFSNFSEAINLFKDELYYKAFKESKHKNFKFDATYFIQSILFALAGQRIAFLLVEKIDKEIKTKYKTKLSDLQRDILINIISKEDEWYLTQDFILGIEDINQGQVSLALSQLVDFKILNATNTKPKEYRFNWSKENMDYIENLIVFDNQNE